MADTSVQRGLVVLDGRRGPSLARWAGRLLVLGARLANYSPREGRQLVVAVSVPARDFAALFISAGWILSQPHVEPLDVLTVAGGIPDGTPVRVATDRYLIADRFFGIDYTSGRPSIHVGKSRWKVESVAHIAAAPDMLDERFRKVPIPMPRSLVRRTGRADTWAADHCLGRAMVAVIGTRARLEPELDLRVGWTGCNDGYDRLGDVVRPDEGRTPTWWSTVLPGGGEDLPDIPRETRLAVLDGSSAIRWLPEARNPPVVVALMDRSSPDESASSAVLQRRSIGQPVELHALRWSPVPGMEAIAFEVMV